MGKVAFTKALIEGLPVPPKRAMLLDAQIPGLVLRLEPSGSRSWYFFKKDKGKVHQKKIGPWPLITIPEARARAQEMALALYRGEAPIVQGPAPTLAELFEWYHETHAKAHKLTAATDAKVWARYVKPSFARKRADAVTKSEVRDLHARIGATAGHYAANRWLALIRAAYNKAIAMEVYFGGNPGQGVTAFREQSRERKLTAKELPAFLAAVDQEPNAAIRDFVYLALYTGARKGNVLAMAWRDVDFDEAVWCIPRTKNGRPQRVPLNERALAILRRRLGEGPGAWVFPARSGAANPWMTEPKAGWARILKRAGLTDFRLHDLRRTLASLMADAGVNLHTIGKALGHQSQAATQIYARLSLEPIRAAQEQALGGLPKGKG